ncbi:MAG: low molecular weight phosphotyrosine protein phosphatase [Muribaculaceae bacterium]|nr:low molecular weight phosphotyrosine protein phosphatase [Muribaculaceae bacterium]
MKDTALPKLPAARPLRVLFVCLGNICRSPAAEGVLRSIVERNGSADRWFIDSAGIGAWHVGQLPDKRMRIHAARRGYDLSHHARQVRPSDFDDFDLIIGMDSGNIADLRELARTPDDLAKIHAMSEWMQGIATRYDHVPDPYYEGAEGFELVLDLLENACGNLAAQI